MSLDLPIATVRGDGVLRVVDSVKVEKVNRMERLGLQLDVPCHEGAIPGQNSASTIPFPPRRDAAKYWREYRPFDIDLKQLREEHEEAFVALHSVLSYFGSRHPPWDEVIIDRQWHTFTIAVWAIIEDPAETEDSRAIAIARWARDNMPDEVFDHPWWHGRWNWYPPSPREIECVDEEDGSEFEFGEGLDGLPVPDGMFLPSRWSAWAADGVGPVTDNRQFS
ncbi:hypothetical protein K466DRAFT_607482 [Polyporus arcularius HHB13444]|uniref:Uncharacterized protein n=1 Tax=Polyporus arcularius HHB13444 TaxID=1314778 RepID=A0A5C3NJQ2_9APHY|nr:hypothetical protein K466DRAFT_607482 [Polyporus arcularius HHB13444]